MTVTMVEWITLEKASKLYNLPITELYILIENKEISFLRLKEWYVDRKELKDTIEQKRIRSWKEEVKNELLYYLDDFEKVDLSTDMVKTKRLPHRDSILYHFIITEIGLLLHREDLRHIFWDVCSIGSMKAVAQKHNMPPKKIYYYYKVCIDTISKRIGKVRSYQIQNEELIEMIRKQNLQINSLKKQLSDRGKSIYLERPHVRMNHFEFCGLSKDSIEKLSWNLEKLRMSTRLLNILKPMDLYTVEDLVRYIKEYGLDSFFSKKNFGNRCKEELLTILITNEILYDETTSPYFSYL